MQAFSINEAALKLTSNDPNKVDGALARKERRNQQLPEVIPTQLPATLDTREDDKTEQKLRRKLLRQQLVRISWPYNQE